MSVNKVILVGHLGADPEVRSTEGGRKVANLRLATNESYKNSKGELIEHTEWHTVEVWGNQAEIAEKYLHKGTLLYIEGKLRTDNWQDQEGKQRYSTKIRVDRFQILGQPEAFRRSADSPTHHGGRNNPESDGNEADRPQP
ncbi:MAG: single-stranded DNA-binding protein [Flavobacteriales bacterium]|nr:single-stranded DNA-binding protein [Flavobacteriales bacterium]